MKTILEKFDNIADMSRNLSDMIDAQEGTEWRTRQLKVEHLQSDYPKDDSEADHIPRLR
jgi:hypothetical protein